MNFIKKLALTAGWPEEKITHFNTELQQQSAIPNDVIFDIGDSTSQFFIVKCGELQVESVVEIEEENSFPIGLEKWESQKVTREVLLKAHTLLAGEIFGLQEIIEQMEKHELEQQMGCASDDSGRELPDVPRKYRVRSLTNSTLIYIQNSKISHCKSLTLCLPLQSLIFLRCARFRSVSSPLILPRQKTRFAALSKTSASGTVRS